MPSSKPLSLIERKEIERLCSFPELSLAEISKKLKRSKNCVSSEVRRSGGRETYNADRAQKESEERQSIKIKSLSKSSKNRSQNFKTNAERIDILEMQMEIIIEQINQLTKGKS
jgi:IS30 family transposase